MNDNASPSRLRADNFDAIRIVAAGSVIFSHAFLIADGHERNEPFIRFLGQPHVLGVYGVFVFLIISGFLVTQSFLTSPTLSSYLWKRFLRIYPGLAACALISACVIAPLFADTTMRSDGNIAYVRDVLLMQDAWFIPGVSFYADPMGAVINGSLWTIRQEIACYAILALFGLTGRRPLVALIAIALITTTLLNVFNLYPPSKFFGDMLFCIPAFLGGVLMYFICERFGRSSWIAGFSCLGLVVAGYLGLLGFAFPFFGAYAVVFLAFAKEIHLGNAARFGDVSYGTYLYGWPIEQMVRSAFGPSTTWWAVFAISLPLALASGWLSWHLVEKHALRLKRWRLSANRAWSVEP